MHRAASLLLSSLASLMLSGCIAAALPLAAAGVIGKGEIDRRREAGLIASAEIAPGAAGAATVNAEAAESGEGTLDPFAMMESGGAAIGIDFDSPYHDWARFALAGNTRLDEGLEVTSAVLVPNVSLVSPQTISCEGKPPAVMIDLDPGSQKPGDQLDGTMLDASDVASLRAAVEQLRAAKITVIWLSARDAADAPALQRELRAMELLPQGAADYLSLDRGPGDRKQLRRWETAELFCILAVAGDARGDFDELYDYLLKPEYAIALERNFGQGWFVVGNVEQAQNQTMPAPPQKEAVAERSAFFRMTPTARPGADTASDMPVTRTEKEQ
ncbi:MAG: hypothetical protein AAFX04_02140 [Pseudomonadota bacterium]